MISKANDTVKIRRNSTEKSTKENEITEGMNAISSRKITSRQTTVRNFRTNLKTENDENKILISNNIEIETLWGEEDESIIQALVDRCKMLEGDHMQVKLEYYYKSLGIETDSIPVQPMKFDSEAPKTLTHQEMEMFYKRKAKENWGRLTKAITCKDIKSFRTLINSVNSYMYPRLKEFVKTIMSPEFQTVMTFLKIIPEDEDLEDKLQYAKTGIMKLNKVLGVEDYEFHTEDNIEDEQIKNDYYDDSLISSLLLLKRSKLEDVVKKIVQYQQKSKQKDLDSLSSKIIFELTNKKLSYQRLNYLTRRAKSKVSSRTVPSFKNSSKLVCRGSVRSKFTSRNVVKTQINSYILDKILSKSPQNSLKSIDEDCNSEYYACNIDDTKHLESESVSVRCADSIGTFNTTPKNLNKLTINQIKQF